MNDRVDDYLSDPEYERRMVAFCDVLGWRSQIASAKSDSVRIGNLRRQILRVQRIIGPNEQLDLRFSSFSDCIVLSAPVGGLTLAAFKALLSDYQLYSAHHGFLTRGAITVGEICHDKQTVFGPALNRAYELESKVAKYPRIIFDRNVFIHSRKGAADLMDEDEECIFLDAFNIKNVDILAKLEPALDDHAVWDKLGLPKFSDQPSSSFEAMTECLAGIKPILRSPLTDKEYERVSWLFDRIAKQLGVPPSQSYPRVTAQ
jgi:hypothetical protein